MPTHEPIIEQLREWARDLETHVLPLPPGDGKVEHIVVAIVGMKALADDLEAADKEA